MRLGDVLLRELPLANLCLVFDLFTLENDVHFLVVKIVIPVEVLCQLAQLRALAQQ